MKTTHTNSAVFVGDLQLRAARPLTKVEIFEVAGECIRAGNTDLDIYRKTKERLAIRYPDCWIIPFQVIAVLKSMGVLL